MIRKITLLSLAIAVSGCASNSPTYTSQNAAQTNAQVRFQLIGQRFAELKAGGDSCVSAVRAHSDAIAAEEILPLYKPDSASVSMLTRTGVPTSRQMRQIIEYKQELDNCGMQAANELDIIDPSFGQIFRKYAQNESSIIAELMQKKINLGEATRAVQLNAQRGKQEGQNFIQNLRASLISQHNAEMAQRQAAQAQNEAELAALGAAMQSTSNQFQLNAMQLQQSTATFQPPQIYTPQLSGGSAFVHCRQMTGMITYCR